MGLVSVERYLAICHPLQLRRWTLRGRAATAAGVLAAAGLLNAAPLAGWSRWVAVE